MQPAAPVGSAHGDDVEPHNRESTPFFQRAPLPRGVAVVGGHVCVDARNDVVCSAGRGIPAVHNAAAQNAVGAARRTFAASGFAARRIADVFGEDGSFEGPEGRAFKIREEGLFELAHQPSSRESRPAIYVRISCPKAAMS